MPCTQRPHLLIWIIYSVQKKTNKKGWTTEKIFFLKCGKRDER